MNTINLWNGVEMPQMGYGVYQDEKDYYSIDFVRIYDNNIWTDAN